MRRRRGSSGSGGSWSRLEVQQRFARARGDVGQLHLVLHRLGSSTGSSATISAHVRDVSAADVGGAPGRAVRQVLGQRPAARLALCRSRLVVPADRVVGEVLRDEVRHVGQRDVGAERARRR